jgi:hypothetical protein
MKYLIKLSDKTEIQIDEDEVAKVKDALVTGSHVRVRQGIFNPAFYTGIIEDTKRMKEHNAGYPKDVFKDGKLQTVYAPPMKNLPDIFEGVNLKDQKQLT